MKRECRVIRASWMPCFGLSACSSASRSAGGKTKRVRDREERVWGQPAWQLLSCDFLAKAPGWTQKCPCDEDILLPLPRWGQLEALKKEKERQLACTVDVCSFLQECGPTQVQLQDTILQLEALETGHSEDLHRILQLAQQKMPAPEGTIYYLQRVAIKYSLGLA